MRFITRQRDAHTEAWWAEALDTENVPLVVRELIRDRRVVTSPDEAQTALAWARDFATWDDDHPALIVDEGQP